jgi:hypothetical protein
VTFARRWRACVARVAAAAMMLGAGLAATVAPRVAGAQAQPPARPRPPADTIRRPPADTIRRIPGDTANRAPGDTTRAPRATLVDWAPDDSVMLALRARAGYRVVQFQAGRVGFDAATREMRLTGTDSARAAVQRDSTLLVADTVAYGDSTKVVVARGDTIVLRDPTNKEDFVGHTRLMYDTERRIGTTSDFRTVAMSGTADWAVTAHQATFVTDSTSDRQTLYGRDGMITSCLDSVPHYHFLAKRLKRVSDNIIVARPAIVYVQGVPVMWLPFIFQDIRPGRRSGILTPRIGFSELVRNSPSYRRTAENLGYYFALSDYVDAQFSVDWRSSARATEQDPGWTAMNAQVQYRWLDRFMGGTLAVQRRSLSTGNNNIAVSWAHQQEFSSRTKFTTNLNYVSSTQVHRQTVINPIAAMSTILSQMNLTRRQGPLNISVGGSRRQYPGRDQVDEDFPSLSISSEPLSIGEWFTANPSLRFAQVQNLNIDATGDFSHRYFQGPTGLDSTRLQRNQRARSLTVGTPFKVFDFQVQSGFRFNEQLNDFPELRTLVDPADTSRRIQRVYARTFLTSADFDVSIGLPQFLQGTFNLSPNVSASNVDPAGFMVRSELSNGEWVTQSKRLSYGVGISPTVFRLLPGFGPIARMRHSISPTLNWSYSPEATVSDEFLAALNKNSTGYLGTLAQNRLSFGLATNIEARMRTRADSDTAAGAVTGPEAEKVRIASIQFTAITYDFERKRKTGRSGIATDRFGYTFRSDLLPGFDLGVDYSLFQGNVLSDTAEFKPYREAVRATFSLTQNSSVVRGIGRLFGYRSGAASGRADNRTAYSDEPGQQVSPDGIEGLGATTGTRARSTVSEIPSGQGFQAAFTVSSQRQRPPVGGTVIDFDPAVQCAQFIGLPSYDVCVQQAERRAHDQGTTNPTTGGGTFVKIPPTTSVGLRTSFNLTPKWAAAWSTTYDVERSDFAQQMVTLQRELHDWRAIFGFTQAPNGNFAFTFFISLKAQPEIKLDYDRQTYRPPESTLPP